MTDLKQRAGAWHSIMRRLWPVSGKTGDLRGLAAPMFYPLLTKLTLRAIKDAEIPAMPADVIPLLPKNDRERLKIHYDALIY